MLTELSDQRLGGLKVTGVSTLDAGQKIPFESSKDGLKLTFTEELPGQYAWVVRISLEGIGYSRPVVRVEHRAEGMAVFAKGIVHNFTDVQQSLDVRMFIDRRGGPSVSRVLLEPGESDDVRFDHRDQNHYGARSLLLENGGKGVVKFQLGDFRHPLSGITMMAFPAISMNGQWLFKGGDDATWSEAAFVDAEWIKCTVPREWPIGRIADQTGWYRKHVTVPDSWKGNDLKLDLGVILDEEVAWFNGVKIGETVSDGADHQFHYGVRKYTVPADLVKFGGDNVIAVRVHNYGVKGGLVGPPGFLTVKE
jgi:hypothetical protein